MRGWPKRALLLGLGLVIMSACSLFPLGSQSSRGTPAPIQLVRCNAYPSALCLQSFGLGQNQLVISVYSPEAKATAFRLKVWQADSATVYPCSVTASSPTILSCAGPLIPLGTPIKIELYTENGREPLAEGEFTLSDLALPTLSSGEASTATPEVGAVGPNSTDSTPATIASGTATP